jgi:hypothetical protein
METERPATEPDILASPLGGTDFAPRSATSAKSQHVTPNGVLVMLRSPTFSILAGIVAPIVCFAVQPLVFSGDPLTLPGLQFVNVFWLFGYGIVGLEMLVLALWLTFGSRLGAWNGPVAGVLFAGALFAGGLGLVLLPFSVIGLMVIIGALGFVPFLTAAVYFANAVEAVRRARELARGTKLVAAVLLGAALVIGVPGALEARASLVVRSAIRDVAAGNPAGLASLRFWYRFAAGDMLVWTYADELDTIRKQRLADAYKELTGEDVESRLARLAD